MIWIWLLTAVAMAMVATSVFLYLPYWRSPQKRWRDAVLRAQRAAKRQVAAEAKELKRLAERDEPERQSLTQEAFDRFLRSISVRELEAYPGIGPATVGRLQQRGYRNLATLRTARIRVKGLGQKRLTDVANAIQQLTREAEGRFRAGACRESQELETRLQQLGLKYAELECRARARAQVSAEVVRQLEKPAAVARHVTYWKYLWKDVDVVVPPEVLQRPLPDLRNAIASAEQQALQACRNAKSRTVVPVANASLARKPPSLPDGVPALVREEKTAPSPLVHSGQSALQSAAATPVLPEAQAHDGISQGLVQATIEFAFAVARADGRITRKEKTLIEEHLQCQYASDPALLNRVKAYCAHYETAAIKVDDCLQRIREWSPVEERAHLLEFAYRVADACGPMNQREVQFLQRVSREWDVPWQPPADTATPEPPGAAATATVPQWPFTISDPRALLEIDAAVPLTADLIRRHYHLLSSRLTPERAEAMGPEFVALAQSKCQAIRAAAEELLQPFGEPLEPADAPAQSAELRYNPDLDAMFGA